MTIHESNSEWNVSSHVASNTPLTEITDEELARVGGGCRCGCGMPFCGCCAAGSQAAGLPGGYPAGGYPAGGIPGFPTPYPGSPAPFPGAPTAFPGSYPAYRPFP
jgi:hypothetical protein